MEEAALKEAEIVNALLDIVVNIAKITLVVEEVVALVHIPLIMEFKIVHNRVMLPFQQPHVAQRVHLILAMVLHTVMLPAKKPKMPDVGQLSMEPGKRVVVEQVDTIAMALLATR